MHRFSQTKEIREFNHMNLKWHDITFNMLENIFRLTNKKNLKYFVHKNYFQVII